MDNDLKDFLDDLVAQSLRCIKGTVICDTMLARSDATQKQREDAMLWKQEFRQALDEVRHCFEGTIDYHDSE